jgi:SWIM zinc finger
VSPGRIAAPVHGSRPRPYRTVVHVEQLTEAQWERFLDEVAGRAGHIAALLDRDMPHDLVDAAADAGVPLLPDVGDLDPECTCPDWGYPCKHAAALSYQAAWLLDQDPFVLLLMRGRGEQELLDELQRRNAEQAAVLDVRPPERDSPRRGTLAAEAYAAPARPLPPPPEVPDDRVGFSVEFAPAAGIEPDALQLLVHDAALRARELLAAADPLDGAREFTMEEDTVRLLASHPELSSRFPPAGSLAREVQAWRYGGRAGLDVFAHPWTPPAGDLAGAQSAIEELWLDGGDEVPELRGWRNRWTLTWPETGEHWQLRYGRDGRWYPYRRQGSDWWPAGPPDPDPAGALALLAGT